MAYVSVQSGLSKSIPPKRALPDALSAYQSKIKKGFERPEVANVLMSFFTGNKSGISPYTKKSFKRVNLSFLLSPSGIHLSGLFVFLTFFIKKIKFKWIKHLTKTTMLSTLFFLPGFESIKRLALLRILFQFKFFSKIKISTPHIFILMFLISFLMGHYKTSPLGFIFSFAFLGTFFSLQNHSKLQLILGLFSTQLILALFLGDKVSLASIPIGLFGSFIFSFIFPLCIAFVGTYWIIDYNWIEPILRIFIISIQWCSKNLNGTFTSSSLFLILAIWIIMMMNFSLLRKILLLICIFLHTNTAMTPVIYPLNLPTNFR